MSNGTISARGQYDALGNLGINTTGAPVAVPGLNYAANDMSGPLNDALKMYRAAIVNASSRPTAAQQRIALSQTDRGAPPQESQYDRQMKQYALQRAKLAAEPTQNYMWQRTAQGQPELVRTQQGIENLGPMGGGLTQTAQASEAQSRASKMMTPLEEEQLGQAQSKRQTQNAWGYGGPSGGTEAMIAEAVQRAVEQDRRNRGYGQGRG